MAMTDIIDEIAWMQMMQQASPEAFQGGNDLGQVWTNIKQIPGQAIGVGNNLLGQLNNQIMPWAPVLDQQITQAGQGIDQALGGIPGVVLEKAEEIANYPGTDYIFPIPMGFVKEKFINDILNKVGKTYKPGLQSVNSFTPKTLEPIEGPIFNNNIPGFAAAGAKKPEIYINPEKLKSINNINYVNSGIGHEIGHNILRGMNDIEINSITKPLIEKFGKPFIVDPKIGHSQTNNLISEELKDFISKLTRLEKNHPHHEILSQYFGRQYGDKNIPFEELIATALGERAANPNNFKLPWQDWPINWGSFDKYYIK